MAIFFIRLAKLSWAKYYCPMNIREKSLKSLEFDKILYKLADFAKTKQSKELCLNLKPWQDSNVIKKELYYTREAKFTGRYC